MSKLRGFGSFTLTLIAASIGLATVTSAQTPCQGSTGPDVIVGDITGPANYAVSGTSDALSLGTTSCNMGTQNLMWNASPSNTHPVIAGSLFRYYTVDGASRFEQVGQSWLKHGFTALTGNLCCTCSGQGGSVLGVGCSDPYTAARNGEQSGLGPKYPVNATTGFFPTGTPTRPSGGNTGRLEVLTTELVITSGGPSATNRYFGQAHYVAPDDAQAGNGRNNASYREVTYNGSNFGFFGSTVREFNAIRAWQVVDPGVTLVNVDFVESGSIVARYILGYKVTPIPGNLYRYEYAVYNMNSHRSCGSFSIPRGANATIQNIGFHDVRYLGGDGVNASGTGGTNYDGTDWPATVDSASVTWATLPFSTHQGANAIRWGTLYNFRFDSNAPPTTGTVTLGLFRPGTPSSLTATAQVPSAVSIPCPGDVDGDGDVDLEDLTTLLSNFGTLSGATPDQGDMNGDGDVDLDDLTFLLSNFGSTCP